MNVKLLRLLSGEDLIAEATNNGNGAWRLKNPVRVVVMPPAKQGDPPNVGFAPWIPYTDDKEMTISDMLVVTAVTPISQFVTQYRSMTSGLALPQTNLILPG